MMIRDAIQEFHDTVAMPVMAPIVVEQPVQTGALERYETRTNARLEAFERNVASLVTASRALSGNLRVSEAKAGDAAELTDFIEHLERLAERMAVDDARTEKDMMRQARSQERREPGLGSAHRRSAIRLAELNALIIETLLALALDLRALRSTVTDSDPSPVFDDGDDLARYLDRAMQA